MTIKSISFVVVTLVLSTNASAALIDNGTTTIDTGTGLEWLDITQTTGLAYNSVLGSDFVTNDGYRYATEAEVFQLFTNAGGTPSDVALGENWAPALLLMDLMGCTSTTAMPPTCELSNPDSLNFSLAVWGDGQYIALVQEIGDPSFGGTGGFLQSRWGPNDVNLHDPVVGSYLVRAVVPVPAAVWLFGSGLIGLIGVARRKKHND